MFQMKLFACKFALQRETFGSCAKAEPARVAANENKSQPSILPGQLLLRSACFQRFRPFTTRADHNRTLELKADLAADTRALSLRVRENKCDQP